MARPLNLNPALIQWLYAEGHSMQEIANHYNCSRPAIYYHVKHARSKSAARQLAIQRGKLDTRDGTALTTAYHHARKHRANTCDKCSTLWDLQIHHKDSNPYNNDPGNLQTLCRDCHKQLHALAP